MSFPYQENLLEGVVFILVGQHLALAKKGLSLKKGQKKAPQISPVRIRTSF